MKTNWLVPIGKAKRELIAKLTRKEAIAAVTLLIALIAFERIVLTTSYQSYVRNLEQHQYSILFAALAVILISFGWVALYFWASFNSTYYVRLVYLGIFTVAAFVEYGYQHAFGRFTNTEDLRIALLDANWEQWTGSIVAYADLRALVPSVAYALLLVRFRVVRQYSWRTLSLVLLLIVCFYTAISLYISGQFATVSLTAFLRTLTTSPWKWGNGYNGPRQVVTFHSEQHPQNNIVFIVDESVRGDHLSINGYKRQTTPYLEKLLREGTLRTWGSASAGTPCSSTSDNLLLTGLTQLELPDTHYDLRKRPTIFQYAKAMGYQTHFLDGQKDYFWMGTSYDSRYVDDWEPVNRFSGLRPFETDALIGRRVNEILDGSTGNFIWIIKRGIHYPYVNNFPGEAAEWQPSTASVTQIDPSQREELINTYDNALKYNLDSFFAMLDVGKRKYKNFFIYTSDHGQTLSEHGERHTHCGTSADTAPTEVMVPLFLISVEPLSVDTRYRASHGNIFATLLDLMNFPQSERGRQYARSLLEAKETDSEPRYFFVGELHQKAFYFRVLFDR